MPLDTTVGGAAADSYNTLAEIRARWANFGFGTAAPAFSDKEVEEAARRAAVWLDGRYADKFPGTPLNGRDQSLAWPRSGAADIDGATVDPLTIPAEIKTAHVEATQREVLNPLSLAPDYVRGQQVKRAKAGPAEVEYHASKDGAAEDIQPFIAAVDNALRRLLTRRVLTAIRVV